MNKFLYDSIKYTIHRPCYPVSLYRYLANLSQFKNTLIDCGVGSGQAAFYLKNYFKHVIAVDLAHDLLSLAPRRKGLHYIQAQAEHLPISPNSVDMVCVAQALHWFSLDKFYDEVRRVLKPQGIIAAWCYNQCTVNPKLDHEIQQIYNLITIPENMSAERKYVYELYQTIPFPFNRIASPSFELYAEWNFLELYGYISTWPSLIEYEKRFGENLLYKFEQKLKSAWGDIKTKKTIKWPINLLVGQPAFSNKRIS